MRLINKIKHAPRQGSAKVDGLCQVWQRLASCGPILSVLSGHMSRQDNTSQVPLQSGVALSVNGEHGLGWK